MLVQDRMTTTTLRLLVVFVSIFAVGALGFSLPRIGGSLTLAPRNPCGCMRATA
jgi:hypothetical protein